MIKKLTLLTKHEEMLTVMTEYGNLNKERGEID